MNKLRYKALILLVSVCGLIGFLLLTYLVKIDMMREFDFITIVKVQDKFPQKLFPVLDIVSTLASFWIITPILFIVIFSLFKLKGLGLMLLYTIGHIIEVILKSALHQPNPPYMFHQRFVEIGFTQDYISPGSSFPSGHSLRVLFVFTVVGFLLFTSEKIKHPLKIAGLFGFFSFTLTVILAKIVFGEHWPTDVIAGSLLGLSLGGLSLYFFPDSRGLSKRSSLNNLKPR